MANWNSRVNYVTFKREFYNFEMKVINSVYKI